ncbi:MAG: hypothetical protein JNL74_14340 [Fibrobacteres bacterium]|nr:hypothetical protein [Fibrobacterota bacterium]
MKKPLWLIITIVLGQFLFAGNLKHGVVAGVDYLLTTHGNYFNPGIDAGYRLRLPLGQSKWKYGADVNVNWFLNKPGVTGTFVGLPIKLALSRQFSPGSWTINTGLSVGGYFSILKYDSVTGKASDLILPSPYLELGPTLGNNSQILLILSSSLIFETGGNGSFPVLLSARTAYVF